MAKLTDEQKTEIADRYKNGETKAHLSRQFGVSLGSIHSILRVRKIPSRGHVRKYCFNERYFDIIDTEDKAYWLGFAYADGNLYKSSFSIKLATKDVDHLEKFKTSIESNAIIRQVNDRDAYRIRLSSTKFAKSLIRVGLIPAKSQVITFPKFLAKELRTHFIRGVFDGDGWFSGYWPKGSVTRSWNLGVCSGSLGFLESIQDELDCGGSLYKRKGGYQLFYGGNQKVTKLATVLYGSASIYLERKFQLYQRLLIETRELDIRKQNYRVLEVKKRKRDNLGRFMQVV